MNNDKTILQRLSEVTHSSDLTHREVRCDVDWLHALGLAGRSSEIGHALLVLDRTLDRRDVPAALRETVALTFSLGKKRGWSLTRIKATRIAIEVLGLYVSPACPVCKGRGVTGVERDRPQEYNPKTCVKCGGSGKRPVPPKYNREIRVVLEVLHTRRHEIGRRVRKAMRTKADVD